MKSVPNPINELLAEAEKLPLSHAKLALLQHAVGIADSLHDITLGIEIRQVLMSVARNLLRGDILAAEFSWCLSHYDQDPSLMDSDYLLWRYRDVIGQLANLDSVSRVTIDELFADCARRLLENGHSEAEMLVTKRDVAPDLGDKDMAINAHRELQRFHRSERGSIRLEFGYYIFIEDYEAAQKIADHCLQRESTCDDGDLLSYYCQLMIPLLRKGEIDPIIAYRERCRQLCKPEICYYWPHGELIKAYALTGMIGEGVRFYLRCQRAIHELTDPLTRLHFALDASVLFDRLRALGKDFLPVRLPESVPIARTSRGISVIELQDWIHRQCVELAERFDKRNGTKYYQEQIQQRKELQSLAMPEIT